MKDESYTFEDYIKDFELDYLGFDGIPDEPVPDSSPEKSTENGPDRKPTTSAKTDRPRPRFQK